MNIRHYQPGDEKVQLAIYNTAAAGLPRFKPATLFEIQKRTQARDFDPRTRWFVEEKGEIVAYGMFQANGRVSFPWCLPGFHHVADPLFEHVLQTMRARGIFSASAAYRDDWTVINDFFKSQGFVHARDMINFVLGFENMPTPAARISSTITEATIEDIPGILALAPAVFRVKRADEFQEAFWKNPYITAPDSVFVMRNRTDGAPIAAGIFITNPTYADPRTLDAAMPCFRLGAFGTEGMTTKRIRGLFSFVASSERNLYAIGMDMLGHAVFRLSADDDTSCFAAQVASDAPGLLSFYQRTFERQGKFPVYERDLTK